MKDKHAWMWLGGVAIAAVFFWLSMRNKSETQKVPYLVPQAFPGANQLPNTDSIGEQSNIVGSSPNQNITNGTNPGGVTSANYHEPVGSWNLMPNINSNLPHGYTPTGQPGYWSLTPQGGYNWSPQPSNMQLENAQ